jgi:hypothetical protein
MPRMTLKEFVEKANSVHNNKYTYEKSEYVNNKTKTIITCPEHGDFIQLPMNHLAGFGCPVCGDRNRIATKTTSQDKFEEKVRQMHGDKYDLSKAIFKGVHDKVCVICPEHGEFYVQPCHLYIGSGCPECRRIARSNARNEFLLNTDKTIDFSQFDFSPSDETVTKDKDDLFNYIHGLLGDDAIRDYTFKNSQLTVFVGVPSLNIAFEYIPLKENSEKYGDKPTYNVSKTRFAESLGFHLIQIYEDEYKKHKELVFDKIKHLLRLSDCPVIGARQCSVGIIDKEQAKAFLDKYHIQGFVGSTLYYGGTYNGELIAVMSFTMEKDKFWNLSRFATNVNYSYPGIANKLFKQFLEDNNDDVVEVKSFLDRRWLFNETNVYTKMGFNLAEVISPDYHYVVKDERVHKFNFRKATLHKKYGLDMTLTESQMVKQLGINRIYDCGLLKYIYRNEND